MALDAQILLSILAHETSSGDISRTLRATPASYSLTLSDGMGANQAQVVWSDSRTIPSASNDIIDLRSLADDRGSVRLTAVKLIYVRNTGTTPINYIGGENNWFDGPQKLLNTSSYEIPPGGCWLATNQTADGWIVSGFFPAASPQVRLMTLANSSESVAATCEIILIGEGGVT